MKSRNLRAEDWRDLLRLAGECRELGDDPIGWRRHLIEALCGLTDAHLGFAGEMEGCRILQHKDLGMVPWMRSGTVGPERIGAAVEDFRGDSTHVPAMLDYFRRDPIPEGTCLGCPEVFDDRSWYASDDYRVVFEPCGFDQTLWCFRPILGAGHDQNTGIVLVRAKGGRPFESRLLFLVREAHAAIAPMIGGPLARFADPSPMDLPQRARPVLACLLEGDGDKQIAARLGLSVYTVNEYTKAIYRHFGVRSRPELLARWIRRGWTSPPSR